MRSENLVIRTIADYEPQKPEFLWYPYLPRKSLISAVGNLRERKGVTQEVLSGLSDIGRTHLSAIERGERKPTLETLYRISRALDVKMSEIVLEIEREIQCVDNGDE
jgi:transcriptional regulator with XRE-family HTH domain